MKTLIIKLGALGDVVRTTVLLRELEGEIYWLTKKNSEPVLSSKKISRIYFIEDEGSIGELKNMEFDLVINLDEEKEVLELLKQLKFHKLIGVFLGEDNEIYYSPESKYWFDMSKISKFSSVEADQLKKENIISVPQIITEMVLGQGSWKEQEYDIGINEKSLEEVKGKIGLINIVTGVWKNKFWTGYNELYDLFEKEGYDVKFLGLRNTIKEHIDDINNCEIIVCGDTFGMHVALALKKKVIALFNCTPPHEIYDYERMIKIVSPLYEDYFYKKELSAEAMSAISVEEVYNAVKEFLKGDKVP